LTSIETVPTADKTAVIITGASAWPHLNLEARDAYANSAIKLESYLTVNFQLSRRNLLRLFDSEQTAADMLTEIGEFIKARRDAHITDLVFCYIGHGDFVGESEFYMPIRSTKRGGELERSTALVGKTLAATLKEHGRFLRQFMMLDCCYAASAAELFKNSVGVAALCSSGDDIASTLLSDGTQTMFSAAVMQALEFGKTDGPEWLSFAQVQEIAVQVIRHRWPDTAILPELHSPTQKEGDLRYLPFFPNPARLSRWGPPGVHSPTGRVVSSTSDKIPPRLTPVEAQRVVAEALAPLLHAAFGHGAQLPGEGIVTFAIRLHGGTPIAASHGANPTSIEIAVLVFNRDDLLRGIDRLLRLTDETDTFGSPQFIKSGLHGASMTGDRAGVSDADLGSRFEQVIRVATSDPPIGTRAVPIERIKEGEWPELSLDLELNAPRIGVRDPIGVRIQVRSLLDDMLSEIHREIRTLVSPGRPDQTERLLRQAEAHLSVLQKMFDGCSAYIHAIRRDMNEGMGGGLAQGQPLSSMSKLDQVRAFLVAAEVPLRLIDEILAVTSNQRDLSAMPIETKAQLVADAETLRLLVERESQPGGYLAKDGPGQRACKYIARMDEALLRVQTDRPEQLASAIEIYKDLEIQFPLSPTVRFRLAWAFGKQKKVPEALEYYMAANKLIEDAMALGQFERDQRVMMHEIVFIRENLSRLIGFQYWAISRNCAARGDPAGQIVNLIEAYRTTEAGLGRGGDDKKTHNNLLYYATEYLLLVQNGDRAADLSTAEITTEDVAPTWPTWNPRPISRRKRTRLSLIPCDLPTLYLIAVLTPCAQPKE
jgi:hypothetical protein